MSDMKDRIVRSLRNADEPARSAKQLAEELDVSVTTINDNIENLVTEDRVQTVEIGNATAYYVRVRDLPAYEKPDHYCSKCGREVNDNQDSARIELQRYFTNHRSSDDITKQQVLCRFCYHDVVHWLHDDEQLMHVYPHVEEWDVPDYQITEVKNDPEIDTEYPDQN